VNKKKQKNFVNEGAAKPQNLAHGPNMIKNFLLLFSKKEDFLPLRLLLMICKI